MEELLAAIILEEEKDKDLLVYSMSDIATDIFKKRKDEGFYSTLIRRYPMDSEMKFREFFAVSRGKHICNLSNIKTTYSLENYSTLNKRRRNGRNYELTITSQNCRNAFPSVNLGNLILLRILAWVVYVHSPFFFHQIPAYSS
jgi:hypothetical protein